MSLRPRMRLLAVVCAVAGLPGGCARQSGTPITRAHAHTSATDAVAGAANGFGFRLYGQLRLQKGAGNIAFSPVGVATALAMPYSGAAGETQKAMAGTLGVQGMTRQQLNAQYARLLGSLQRPGHKVELHVASALWLQRGLEFRRDFVARCRRSYHAQVANVLFSDPRTLDTINDWVKRETDGPIPALVQREEITGETVLALANAVAFDGRWQKPFEREMSHDEVFTLADGTRKEGPMMRRHGRYPYYEGKEFQVVCLPYANGRMGFYAFLPRKGTRLAALEDRLVSGTWEAWMGQLHESQGVVMLPRFRTSYRAALKPVLQSLGMGVAFDRSRADFADMSPSGCWMEVVRHEAALDVNEEGTRAVAATSGIMAACMVVARPGWFSMVMDRPFLFAIRDTRTRAMLFLGRVMDPGADPGGAREWQPTTRKAQDSVEQMPEPHEDPGRDPEEISGYTFTDDDATGYTIIALPTHAPKAAKGKP